jgi:hypothetical protein
VGEQSNAYRILLRYDRKSRHRRIKKQRRYERLAATSQLSLWYVYSMSLQHPKALGWLDLLSLGPISGGPDYILSFNF